MIAIGTAGWNIPRAHKPRFPAVGTGLQRYAGGLNAVEINTSFYRPHAAQTYARWAAAVPAGFRFAVKMPKVISHERALTRARAPLEQFLAEIAGLGGTLGVLLLQLPPSHAFDARRVGRFFELLRARHDGAVVCEPRHATWASWPRKGCGYIRWVPVATHGPDPGAPCPRFSPAPTSNRRPDGESAR